MQDRLFAWQAESRRLAVEVPTDFASMTHLSTEGGPARWAVVAERQAICRSDDTSGTVLEIFGAGYTRHQ